MFRPPGARARTYRYGGPQPLEHDYLFTHAGDGRVQDRLGWAIDHLTDYCVLDWVPGDGATPLIGPAFGTVDGGGPVTLSTSPWVGSDGELLPVAHFDGTTAYRTSTGFDPSSGQDVRMIALARPFNNRTSTLYRVCANRNAGAGFSMHYRSDTERWSWYGVDDVGSRSVAQDTFLGWTLLDGWWDLDGTMRFRANGDLSSGAAPGGDHLAGDGLGIGSFPDGSGKWRGLIARVLVYFGTSTQLANTTDYADIVASVFGTADTRDGASPTFGRSSDATLMNGTSYHIVGAGAPRSGGASGLFVEPAGTNKCFNTIHPQATTGWTATGGTHTVVDDTAALDSAGLLEFGPDVHRFVPGVSDQVVYGGGSTANTNPHSLSVFMRGSVGGESVVVGLRDISGTNVQTADTVVLTTAWVRYPVSDVTPTDIDMQFALDCDSGDTVLFIMPQLEESPFVTSPIPNLATAAAASRAQDVLDLDYTPSDTEGSVLANVEPVGWGADAATAGDVVTRVGSASSIVRYDTASGGQWLFDDGTTQVIVAEPPVDGTAQAIRTRWGDSSISIDIDGTRDTDTYDGVLAGSGALRIDGVVPACVRGLKIFRNGRG